MAVRFSADGQDYTAAPTLGSQANLSMCGWVKINTDLNQFSTFFGGNDGTINTPCVLQTQADGTTLCWWGTGGAEPNIGALTVGTWYFISAVMTGTTLAGRVRADGSNAWLYNVSIASGSATKTVTNWQMGESINTAEWLDGCITAVKFWTTNLSDAEMMAESYSHMPVRTASLALWYPLLKPETTDYSGNGRTLSGGSGAAVEDGPKLSWSTLQVPAPLSTPTVVVSDGAEWPTVEAPWTPEGPGEFPLFYTPTEQGETAASTSTTVLAECATATAAVVDVQALVSVTAENALATAATVDVSAAIVVNPAEAAASAATVNPSAALIVPAENALATAATVDATAITANMTTVLAECATATSATADAQIAIAVSAEAATATSAAADTTTAIVATAETATATAATADAQASVAAQPGVATGTAATVDTQTAILVAAEAATATSAAADPQIQLIVPAIEALAAAANADATVATGLIVAAGVATATAAPADAAVSIMVAAGAATATAAAFDAVIPAGFPGRVLEGSTTLAGSREGRSVGQSRDGTSTAGQGAGGATVGAGIMDGRTTGQARE